MEKATKQNNYHYNKNLQTLAVANKKNMTKSAAAMWKFLLSKKQMMGFSFRRERPILRFIVDFVCLELMLIVEVDGIYHTSAEDIAKDTARDVMLTEVGFTVLRFSSHSVLTNLDAVRMHLEQTIENILAESE